MLSLSPSARLAGLPGVVPVFSFFADLGILTQGFLAIMLGGIGTVEWGGADVVGVLSGPYPGRWRPCWPTSWFS